MHKLLRQGFLANCKNIPVACCKSLQALSFVSFVLPSSLRQGAAGEQQCLCCGCPDLLRRLGPHSSQHTALPCCFQRETASSAAVVGVGSG